MFLEYLSMAYEWFLGNGLIIAFVGYLIVYRKYIYQTFFFTPLAGGNGKIQMDELVKAVVVVIFIWCVRKDGMRTHEWRYFSDAFFSVLLAGVFAIAAIKPVVSVLNTMRNDNRKNNEDRAEIDSGDSNSDKPVGDH
jgi:hypothetical protein